MRSGAGPRYRGADTKRPGGNANSHVPGQNGESATVYTQDTQNRDARQGEQLPLFAPVPLRERLRDFHRYPAVGVRRCDGRFWTTRQSAERAWRGNGGRWPYIQLASSGRAQAAIILDCDEGGLLWERLADGDIPAPSWRVWRMVEDVLRAHVGWALAGPVYTGANARITPLQTLARCSEWLAQTTGADASYAGLLTRNPCHEAEGLTTEWGRAEPYALAELLDWVPRGWRRPRLPATAEGRNCAVFEGLRRWAYQPRNWDAGWEGLLQAARALNALHAVPLGEPELGDTVKSVHGWMAGRLAGGQWQQGFLEIQAARGRKSGEARRRRTLQRDYRIKLRAREGASVSAIAAEFELDRRAVRWILARPV